LNPSDKPGGPSEGPRRKRGEEHSQELRDRVLDEPGAVRDVAARFGVSAAYVSKVRARLRLTGQRTTKPRGGPRQPILAGREDLLRAMTAELPDATLQELRRRLLEIHGIKISAGALWKTLRRLGLRFKRARAAPQNEPD
jgi:transposase